MQTRQHIEELIRVSQMYYDEGLNQSQIAGEIGYSRSSVSRMLTEARETGIVQILPSGTHCNDCNPLRRIFGTNTD